MKLTFIIISIFFTLNVFAQAEGANFFLNGSEISWQKVYDAKMTKDELITYFKNFDKFWHVEVVADTIITKLKPQKVDPVKTGVAGIPPLVNKTAYKGLIRIELKEKKYRITLKNIILIGDGEILKKGAEQTFEQNFLNKDKTAFRPYFLKKPKTVYNVTFNEIFQIKVKPKNEW
jgi:hypothetical protein